MQKARRIVGMGIAGIAADAFGPGGTSARSIRVGGPRADYAIAHADNRDYIPAIPDDSIDLVVTSPPYFQQREYSSPGLGNERCVDEYLDNIIETLRMLKRVVKPTGSIVYNIGDKIIDGGLRLVPYRFAVRAIDELDLRLVNDITWVKRNPTPHQFARRLVNSTEPFFHFALSGGYYHDRAAFQPQETAPRSKPTPKLGGKYRQQIDDSDLSADERAAAHRALDDVVSEVRRGDIHSFRMKLRGVHAPAYGGQDGGRKTHIERDGFTIIRISGQRMKRDVIETPVESIPGNGHPAVFPVKVVREIIRMLCPPDGVVLDPYLGSGSTMVAARREGRSCVGIDISERYCEIAAKRVFGDDEND